MTVVVSYTIWVRVATEESQMSDAAAPTHPDLKDTLEEMRASVAARGARNGLTRAMQRLMLTILEMFLTLLADFRAGKLAPVVAAAKDAVDCPSPSLKGRGIQGSASLANGTEYTVAYPPPQPSPSGPIAPCAMGARSRGEGEANRCFSARTAAMADGLPADAPSRAERFGSVARWIAAPDQVRGRLCARMPGSVGDAGSGREADGGCAKPAVFAAAVGYAWRAPRSSHPTGRHGVRFKKMGLWRPGFARAVCSSMKTRRQRLKIQGK